MALPSSGSISAANINVELGRASTNPLSLGGATERALAGIASGSISFASFHGKSSQIEKALTGGDGAITLESLFTGADWTSDTAKVVTLASGVERGTSIGATAVTIGSTPWGGTLTFNVNGTISGKGGAASGGVGGDAFNANITGASGQKIVLNVTGTLRAGGGGGGDGGAGGNGSETSSVREPASGYYYSQTTPKYYFYRSIGVPQCRIMWDNVEIAAGFADTTTQTVGDYTYYATNVKASYGPGQVAQWPVNIYDIFRTSTSEVTTYGGAGGLGGVGQGYGQARAYGTTGSSGDTNAGTGGDGGRGGDWGAQGATGTTGTNGTVTSGSVGLSGGLSGYAILNSANATLTNNGTLIGRTG